MRMMIYVLAMKLVLCIFHVSPAFGLGFTNWHTIDKVATDSQGFKIKLNSAHTNPDTCDSNRHVMIGADNVSYRELMATALSAFYAGKEVRFRVSDCRSIYPIVIRVEVR